MWEPGNEHATDSAILKHRFGRRDPAIDNEIATLFRRVTNEFTCILESSSTSLLKHLKINLESLCFLAHQSLVPDDVGRICDLKTLRSRERHLKKWLKAGLPADEWQQRIVDLDWARALLRSTKRAHAMALRKQARRAGLKRWVKRSRCRTILTPVQRFCIARLLAYQPHHIPGFRRNWKMIYCKDFETHEYVYALTPEQRMEASLASRMVRSKWVGNACLRAHINVVRHSTDEALKRFIYIERSLRACIMISHYTGRAFGAPVSLFTGLCDALANQVVELPADAGWYAQSEEVLPTKGTLFTSAQYDMICSYVKTHFAIPVSVMMVTQVVASIFSIIHHVYGLYHSENTAGRVLAGIALVGQIVNLVVMIATTIKVALDLKHARSVVEDVVQSLMADVKDESIQSSYSAIVECVTNRILGKSVDEDVFGDFELVKSPLDLTNVERISKERYGVSPDYQPQSWNSGFYFRLGIFCVSAVITGISAYTGKNWDWSIVKNHQMRKALNESVKETEELVAECASQWFGVQLSTDVLLHVELEKLYKRMQEILLMAPQEVVNNLAVFYEAQRLHITIVEMVGRKTASEQYGTRNLQQAIIRKSEEFALYMQKVVSLMKQKNTRVETVALHLFGKPACGKTRFVNNYLNQRVAEEMGWPLDEVYPVSFSSENDYWPEYTGARNAVYDEFLGRRGGR